MVMNTGAIMYLILPREERKRTTKINKSEAANQKIKLKTIPKRTSPDVIPMSPPHFAKKETGNPPTHSSV
jgi:hypothetical protein